MRSVRVRLLRRAVFVQILLFSAASLCAKDYLHWPDVENRAPSPKIAGRRLIVLGWDGADWELLDSLISRGQMPNLARFVAEGRSAVLESFPPTVSPMVWTTIATGAEPQDHGILSFFEIDPASGDHVPVSVVSRRVPAYWDTASARGMTVGVVNYWATSPAAEVKGFLVGDRACPTLDNPDAKELSSSVFPPAYAAGVELLLSENPNPSPDVLDHFGDFSGGEREGQKALMLARLLRNTRVTEEEAERLYDKERPQSMTVYFLGTDEVDHLFGKETPPRLPCVSTEDFSRFSSVVERYYGWMDELLGRWMKRAREDGAAILLVSDHGFKWGARRSCTGSPLENASAVFSHRLEGIATAWGRGVRASTARGKISVFDLEPTIAAVLSLPVDRKVTGKALTGWFEGTRAPAAVDLWATSPPLKHLPRVVPSGADEYARRLASLGYLSPGARPKATVPRGPRPEPDEEGWLNLGAYQNSRGRTQAAAESFRRALDVAPGYPAALVDLTAAYLKLGRQAEAMSAAREALRFPGPRQGWCVYEIAARLEQAGLAADEEKFLTEAVKTLPDSEPVLVSLAGLRLDQGRCSEALDTVSRFLSESRNVEVLNVAGVAAKCLHRDDDARRWLSRSLSINPDQPKIRSLMGR